MDIDKFFNSQDMATCIKETGYSLTIQDMARIIDQSRNTTLEEKIAAWKELIETLPDCPVSEHLRRVHIARYHHFLKEYIKVKENLMEDFYDSDDAVYTYDFFDDGWRDRDAPGQDWLSVEDKEYFSDPDACFDHYRKYAQGYAMEHVKSVGFGKHLIRKGTEKYKLDAHITMETTPGLEVINIQDHGTLTGKELVIDSEFALTPKLSLPVPFRDGDILTDSTMERPEFSYPFVLKKDGYKEEMTTRDEGSFIHVSGDEETPHLVGFRNPLSADYEEAQEPLEGLYQLLKPLSNSIRTDPETGQRMIDTELTLSAYHLLLREQMSQAELKNLRKDYTKEQLEAVGLEG